MVKQSEQKERTNSMNNDTTATMTKPKAVRKAKHVPQNEQELLKQMGLTKKSAEGKLSNPDKIKIASTARMISKSLRKENPKLAETLYYVFYRIRNKELEKKDIVTLDAAIPSRRSMVTTKPTAKVPTKRKPKAAKPAGANAPKSQAGPVEERAQDKQSA